MKRLEHFYGSLYVVPINSLPCHNLFSLTSWFIEKISFIVHEECSDSIKIIFRSFKLLSPPNIMSVFSIKFFDCKICGISNHMHHLEICSEICVRSILVTGRAAHVPVTNPSSCLLKVVTGLRSQWTSKARQIERVRFKNKSANC